MSKYKSIDDIYCWEDGILINKLNIHDHRILEQKEKDISTAKALVYDLNSNVGDFNLKHYLTIHKFLFDDIYDWAGKIRRITLSKDGTIFAPMI
jgi:cell filamentation protein